MHLFHVKRLLIAGSVASLLGGLLVTVALPAAAQKMYRCPGTGGSTTFTDTPCAGGPGSEVQVKPAGGSGGSSAGGAASGATQDANKAAKDKKQRADNMAKLSPECRRAADAYDAKAGDKSGQAELAVKGNPITAAWQKCVLDRLVAETPPDSPPPNAAQLLATGAAEQKRREQNAVIAKQLECTTKLNLLAERRPRLAQMSEQDRAAFRAVEQSLPADCR